MMKKFLNDLNNIIKLKDKKIQLWQSDPQYLKVKAFLSTQGIPFKIPDGLKLKKK